MLMTTGPINKEAWQAAGITISRSYRIVCRTGRHGPVLHDDDRPSIQLQPRDHACGYRDVPDLLTTELILEVIELTHVALQSDLSVARPKLIMLGLNPHAGEGGLFGNREEESIIQPAAAAARAGRRSTFQIHSSRHRVSSVATRGNGRLYLHVSRSGIDSV